MDGHAWIPATKEGERRMDQGHMCPATPLLPSQADSCPTAADDMNNHPWASITRVMLHSKRDNTSCPNYLTRMLERSVKIVDIRALGRLQSCPPPMDPWVRPHALCPIMFCSASWADSRSGHSILNFVSVAWCWWWCLVTKLCLNSCDSGGQHAYSLL